MGFLLGLYKYLLYQPLFNILILFYVFIPGKDFGIAIIALTIIIKFLLYPLSAKAIKSQRHFKRIQPLVKELQEKYKHDKTVQGREIMALYKKEKINPFSPFLTLLIQVPILIALYSVFKNGLQSSEMFLLYDFVPSPSAINPFFLRIVDLSKPNWVFAVIAAVLQFWQAKSALIAGGERDKNKSRIQQNPNRQGKKIDDMSKIMEKQMLYFMPAFTLLILLSIPSAIGLYWIVNTLFTIAQQYLILGKYEQG